MNIPGGAVPIKIFIQKGRVILLCPVEKLSSVPKDFPLKVQADFMVVNNFEDNEALLTGEGIIYTWGTVIHRLPT